MTSPRPCRQKVRSRGFTLIEVVIAIAIGVAIVVAVMGTVQSLSRTAQRLEDAGVEDEAWLRFAGIFRRDVRGWVPGERRREAGNRDTRQVAAKPFFVCRTTADGLADSVQAGAGLPGRMAEVRYSVQRKGDEFVVLRSEGRGGEIFSAAILRVDSEPKMEFFDGDQWHAGHHGQQSPMAVRLTVGQREVCVRLGSAISETQRHSRR